LFAADHALEIHAHCACAASVGVYKGPLSLEQSVAPHTQKRAHLLSPLPHGIIIERQKGKKANWRKGKLTNKGKKANSPKRQTSQKWQISQNYNQTKAAPKTSLSSRHFVQCQKLATEIKDQPENV